METHRTALQHSIIVTLKKTRIRNWRKFPSTCRHLRSSEPSDCLIFYQFSKPMPAWSQARIAFQPLGSRPRIIGIRTIDDAHIVMSNLQCPNTPLISAFQICFGLTPYQKPVAGSDQGQAVDEGCRIQLIQPAVLPEEGCCLTQPPLRTYFSLSLIHPHGFVIKTERCKRFEL